MALPQIVTSTAGSLSIPFVTPALRLLTFSANTLMPIEPPEFNEAVNATLGGFLHPQRLEKIALSNGFKLVNWDEQLWKYATTDPATGKVGLNGEFLGRQLNAWDAVIRNRLYLPSIDECGQMLRRETITNELYTYMVGRQVDRNLSLVGAWKDLTNEIPGPQDLIRFAVREAYSPNLIELFGYHKEVPIQVLPWMKKQGYGGTTGLQIPNGGTDGDGAVRAGDATWFDLYWWAHWELPSLTQGYEMLHRLYPTSDYGRSPVANDANMFTPASLELLQKAQDIPDYWRQRLQAISYHPIDKVDGQRLFDNNLITESDMYHILRQHGHNDTDCKTLLKLAILRRQRNLGIDPGKQSLTYVCEYYKLGIVSEDQAVLMLQKQGFDADDTLAFINKCKLEIKGDTVKSTIKTLEQAYYRGIYSYEEIRIELLRNKLNPAVTDYWLVRWKYNRDIKFKPASARQNLTAYKNGVLTEANLVTRLFNLGYDGNSINIMVANQKAIMLQAQTTALLKQAREKAKQQKAAAELKLKAQKKALKKQQDDAKIVTNKAEKRLRNLVKSSSDANVKSWYKDGCLLLWEVYYRMYAKGYSINDATCWVEHNFPDTTKDERNGSAKKASEKFRADGYYIE